MLHVVRWKNNAPVYLHCEVSLCEHNCAPKCNRRKRETSNQITTILLDDITSPAQISRSVTQSVKSTTLVKNGPLVVVDPSTARLSNGTTFY